MILSNLRKQAHAEGRLNLSSSNSCPSVTTNSLCSLFMLFIISLDISLAVLLTKSKLKPFCGVNIDQWSLVNKTVCSQGQRQTLE